MMKFSLSGAPPLLLCLGALAAHAQNSAPQTPVAKTPAVKAPVAKALATKPATVPISERKAQEMTSRVLRETSAIRQLPIKRPVPSGVETRAQVERMLTGKIADKKVAKQLASADIVFRQLGLVPPKFNLKATEINMMGEQIAGYYSSDTKKFVTTDRVDPALLETVMAHELTHALQDQSFDLRRLEKWPDHDSDAQLAFSALVEGDATLTMSRYMTANPLRMIGALASSLKAQGDSPTFNAAPRVLRESVTFPYLQGLNFATSLYQRGGWSAVSAAFKTLPQSTEQILHFDKYLAREAPLKVPLHDLSAVLGRNWTLLDHDVDGEFGIYQVLAEHLGDDDAAHAAAAGWAGDRYSVYRDAKNHALVVQDCQWDSEIEARQFREAYARAASKRFGLKPQNRGALQVWNAAPNGVWLEQRGKRVLVLEGSVGSFNAAQVLKSLWS